MNNRVTEHKKGNIITAYSSRKGKIYTGRIIYIKRDIYTIETAFQEILTINKVDIL